MRGLGADGGDFVPAVTLDDDRSVANGNADDAWDAYAVSAKWTVLALRSQTAQSFYGRSPCRELLLALCLALEGHQRSWRTLSRLSSRIAPPTKLKILN
jgi:hypothetical protein